MIRRGTLLAIAALAGWSTVRGVEPTAAEWEQLDARRQAISAIRMQFTHTRESSLFERPQVRAGTFLFRRELGAAMVYEQPEIYVVLILPEEAVLVRPDGTAEHLRLRADPLLGGMARLLQADLRGLRDHFQVEMRGDNPVDLILRPARRQVVDELRLTMDRVSGVLTHLVIREASGDVQDLAFTDPVLEAPAVETFRAEYWQQQFQARAAAPGRPAAP